MGALVVRTQRDAHRLTRVRDIPDGGGRRHPLQVEPRDVGRSHRSRVPEGRLPVPDGEHTGRLHLNPVQIADSGSGRLVVGQGHIQAGGGRGEGEVAGSEADKLGADGGPQGEIPDLGLVDENLEGGERGGHRRATHGDPARASRVARQLEGVAVRLRDVVTVAKPGPSRLAKVRHILLEEVKKGEILHRQVFAKAFIVDRLQPFLLAYAGRLGHEIERGVGIDVVGVGEVLAGRIERDAVGRLPVEEEIVAIVESAVAAVVHLQGKLPKVIDARVGVVLWQHHPAITENRYLRGGYGRGQPHGRQILIGDLVDAGPGEGELVPQPVSEHGLRCFAAG